MENKINEGFKLFNVPDFNLSYLGEVTETAIINSFLDKQEIRHSYVKVIKGRYGCYFLSVNTTRIACIDARNRTYIRLDNLISKDRGSTAGRGPYLISGVRLLNKIPGVKIKNHIVGTFNFSFNDKTWYHYWTPVLEWNLGIHIKHGTCRHVEFNHLKYEKEELSKFM